MRYLKFFLLLVVFFLAMLFFAQNNQALSTPLQLELNLVLFRLYSLPLPLFFLVLCAFFLGAALTLAVFALERIRLGLELKGLRTRYASLEDEVLTLRTLPLNQPQNQPGGQSGAAS